MRVYDLFPWIALVLSGGVLRGQATSGESPQPVVRVTYSMAAGDRERWDGVVFQGQPLEISVQLSNAVATAAFSAYLIDVAAARQAAAHNGMPMPLCRFDRTSIPPIGLPSERSDWTDHITVSIDRWQDGPMLGGDVLVPHEEVRQLIEAGTFTSAFRKEIRDTPVGIVVRLAPERTLGFPEGEYIVRVTYDTSNVMSESLNDLDTWRGIVTGQSRHFEVKRAEAVREVLAVDYRCVGYRFRVGDYAGAAVRARSILDRAPDYANHRVYLTLAEAEVRQGNTTAAIEAWNAYLAAEPEDREAKSNIERRIGSLRAGGG